MSTSKAPFIKQILTVARHEEAIGRLWLLGSQKHEPTMHIRFVEGLSWATINFLSRSCPI